MVNCINALFTLNIMRDWSSSGFLETDEISSVSGLFSNQIIL